MTANVCFFVSDLHGDTGRYRKLFGAIKKECPGAVFWGGDLLPSANLDSLDFIDDYLVKKLTQMRQELKSKFPHNFLILGNDDGRWCEAAVMAAAEKGIWEYIHDKKTLFKTYPVFGYSYVPPTPFLLKDWEKYDISRHVDPGSVSPEEGIRSFHQADDAIKYSTIKKDLEELVRDESLEKAIFLFHAPPYKTNLDRAALDGKMIDYVPLDVNVGSIAIQRFIKDRQPLLTLHGHIHEASRLSGSWHDRIGRTRMFTAAYDGPQLALVRFDPGNPDQATRQLL